MLETVLVAAIVMAALAVLFRSFYRSLTGKEDSCLYGGTCSGACNACERESCQEPQHLKPRETGTGTSK